MDGGDRGGLAFARRHALRWLAMAGLAACAWLAPGFAQEAWAQTTTECYPAADKGDDGPIDYGAYCWIDFTDLDMDQAGGSGQPFQVDLRGGAYLTFTLRITPLTAAGDDMFAVSVPSWTGAAFGNSAFNNIDGRPILYQDQNNQNDPQSRVTLSELTLHANGSTELPFVFVAADGESTNDGETLTFTTSGDPWTLVSTPGASNPNRDMPVLNPATSVGNSTGSQTVTETGMTDEDQGSYVFTTDNSPGTVTAELNGNGLQGVLFGVKYHTIGLSLTKSHVGQFVVGGTGSYVINVANTVISPTINPPTEPQPIRVVDTLPDGLTYASASGDGWTCSHAAQVITCDATVKQDLTVSRTFPPITIGVNVDEDAPASVVNQAEVSDPTTTTLVFNVCELANNGVCPNSATSSTGDPTDILNPNAPSSGNKQLYLLMGAPDTGHDMTRTVPSSDGTLTWNNDDDNDDQYFYLPPLSEDLVLDSSTVSVLLRGRRSPTWNSSTRNVRVRLYLNGTGFGNAISDYSDYMNFNVSSYTNRSVNITSNTTSFQAGDQLILRVQNANGADVQLTQRDGTSYSYVTLDAATVINVDSVGFFDAQYPATTSKTTWEPGDTVYIRADISDPFGGFDVSAANSKLTLADADGGALILNGATMVARTNPTEGDGVPNRILEYAYTIPATPSYGEWTATVTGSEGRENTIFHSRFAKFTVVQKSLEVVKSHAADFVAGAESSYTLAVTNHGGAIAAGTTTRVEDTLAEGLGFVSGTGTGWDCSATGQDVACTSTAAVAAGADMAPITLTVTVDGSLGASVDNQASVGNSSVDGGSQVPGNIDTATILHPDLSGSTKTVTDLNGGDVAPGDVLRYTITLTESANAQAHDVSVTDPLPANTTGLSVFATPAGSTDASTASQLTVTGITVPANSSVQVVFDVTVANGAAPGTTIENTATVDNPNGPGATPAAEPKTVLESQVIEPAEGNKVLYLYNSGAMNRVQTGPANTGGRTVGAFGGDALWTLTPGVQQDLEIEEGTVRVSLRAARASCTYFCYTSLTVQLLVNGTAVGTSAAATVGASISTVDFDVPLASTMTIQPTDSLALRVVNDGWTSALVYQYNNAQSTVTFETKTVINVDSVGIFSAPYPSTASKGQYVQGDTFYVRTQVSDPFGAADINRAELTLTDAGGTVRINGTSMAQVASAAATRTFETAYLVPDNPRIGGWKAQVVAIEGTEVDPVIDHEGLAYATVHGVVTLDKAWSGANEDDAVDLTIAGGSSTVAGSSIAPDTTTAATASAAAGATVTLAEAFTVGIAGEYTPVLACTRELDDEPVAVVAAGLSATITMPDDSAVACTWTNTRNIPLTMVKTATTYWDPVNLRQNPKAIPGALVTYEIVVAAPGGAQADADSVVVTDEVPANTAIYVDTLDDPPGAPSIEFDPESSSLVLVFGGAGDAADGVEFSTDGIDWDYVPQVGADGTDPGIHHVRFLPTGTLGSGEQASFRFRVRVE